MDSSGSERISRVIIFKIDDKQGTRNADLAELENLRWFYCASVYMDLLFNAAIKTFKSVSSSRQALKENSRATILSLTIWALSRVQGSFSHTPNPLVLSPFYSDCISLYYDLQSSNFISLGWTWNSTLVLVFVNFLPSGWQAKSVVWQPQSSRDAWYFWNVCGLLLSRAYLP